MITQDSIETAYCFFHQKHRVYVHSHDERQREDIEWAVEDYASSMSRELYATIATHPTFLRNPTTFLSDLETALRSLEALASDTNSNG